VKGDVDKGNLGKRGWKHKLKDRADEGIRSAIKIREGRRREEEGRK
jgi:hypothetical protein